MAHINMTFHKVNAGLYSEFVKTVENTSGVGLILIRDTNTGEASVKITSNLRQTLYKMLFASSVDQLQLPKIFKDKYGSQVVQNCEIFYSIDWLEELHKKINFPHTGVYRFKSAFYDAVKRHLRAHLVDHCGIIELCAKYPNNVNKQRDLTKFDLSYVFRFMPKKNLASYPELPDLEFLKDNSESQSQFHFKEEDIHTATESLPKTDTQALPVALSCVLKNPESAIVQNTPSSGVEIPKVKKLGWFGCLVKFLKGIFKK